MDQIDIMKSLDSNVNRKSALDVLMQVDEYLDTLNIYAYPNWFKGEIVEGPEIEKYWVTVTLMYPYKMMPDPEGAERILASGGKVYYAKDTLVTAAKLVDPEDRSDIPDPRRPGMPAAKKIDRPVWLVTLEIPRQYMDDMQASKLQADDAEVDTTELADPKQDQMGEVDAG
tara:strand:+ start:115 stop:627 length:513 start_codon:yes stop_codon:yes gene_type:complete